MGMVERYMRRRYLALQASANAAMKHFEKHGGFPAVQIEVMDAVNQIGREFDECVPGTAGRLQLVLRLLDARSSGYLPLIADIESQNAYMKLLAAFGNRAVEEYFGYSSAVVQYNGSTDAERAIHDRVQHWVKEGYRRLAQPAGLVATRRGYRAEVKAWMLREGIANIPEAATELGVSETTLKSIMSDQGEKRYSDDTLTRILKVVQSEEG